MSKIPTISQQMFGDLNTRLNSIRNNMNDKIKEKAEDLMEKKKKA